MSFEEIKAAVLALPAAEQELILESIIVERPNAVELTLAQAADLARREAELDAGRADAVDGEVVFDRLFAKYSPSTPREGAPRR